MFRIARRVAKDRVISTVDPEARHGHKTAARGFDGYKGHAAVDPDLEIITATTVSPGNTADGAVAEELIADLLGEGARDRGQAEMPEQSAAAEVSAAEDDEPVISGQPVAPAGAGRAEPYGGGDGDGDEEPATVYGATPTAPASSKTCSTKPASTPGARANGPPRQVACSPRTSSPSTSTWTR